ncbi:MAG: hypothetical protein FWF34_00785 [Alphaproteobacteria bacterium]|nr:hypothetical protein [Alphaproteobacteria bacterium]
MNNKYEKIFDEETNDTNEKLDLALMLHYKTYIDTYFLDDDGESYNMDSIKTRRLDARKKDKDGRLQKYNLFDILNRSGATYFRIRTPETLYIRLTDRDNRANTSGLFQTNFVNLKTRIVYDLYIAPKIIDNDNKILVDRNGKMVKKTETVWGIQDQEQLDNVLISIDKCIYKKACRFFQQRKAGEIIRQGVKPTADAEHKYTTQFYALDSDKNTLREIISSEPNRRYETKQLIWDTIKANRQIVAYTVTPANDLSISTVMPGFTVYNGNMQMDLSGFIPRINWIDGTPAHIHIDFGTSKPRLMAERNIPIRQHDQVEKAIVEAQDFSMRQILSYMKRNNILE